MGDVVPTATVAVTEVEEGAGGCVKDSTVVETVGKVTPGSWKAEKCERKQRVPLQDEETGVQSADSACCVWER